MWRVLTLCVIAITLAGTQTSCRKPARHEGRGRVANRDVGFSFVPPAGWQEAKNPNAFLQFNQPDGAATVQVRAVKPAPVDLQKYAENAKADQAKAFKNWKMLEESHSAIDGKTSYLLVSRYETPAGTHDLQMVSLLYFIVGGTKGNYVVAFSMKETSYPAVRDALEKTAGSIQID